MKNSLRFVFFWILITSVPYLVGVMSNVTFDLSKWEGAARVLVAFLTGVLAISGLSILLGKKHEELS